MTQASLWRTISVALVALAAVVPALGQDYPSRPVRVVVPFPAGGGTDIVARMVTQKLAETMGAHFIIDNRGGAGGTIGTDIAAKSAPDGYTLVMVSGSHAINPSLYKKLPYDTARDFAAVTMLVSGPGLLVIHPSVPAKTVKDLIALARSRPGELNYASAGSGTPPHLAAELFKTMARVDIVHVPYRGNTLAFVDLLGGQVSLSFPTIPSALPHVRSGKLRVLAVTSAQRSKTVPDIATIAESGLPGYEASSWYGLLAPAGTPDAVVEKLQKEISKVLRDPHVRDRLLGQGLDPVGNSPAEFAVMIKSEIGKWAKVVQASGAKAD